MLSSSLDERERLGARRAALLQQRVDGVVVEQPAGAIDERLDQLLLRHEPADRNDQPVRDRAVEIDLFADPPRLQAFGRGQAGEDVARDRTLRVDEASRLERLAEAPTGLGERGALAGLQHVGEGVQLVAEVGDRAQETGARAFVFDEVDEILADQAVRPFARCALDRGGLVGEIERTAELGAPVVGVAQVLGDRAAQAEVLAGAGRQLRCDLRDSPVLIDGKALARCAA